MKEVDKGTSPKEFEKLVQYSQDQKLIRFFEEEMKRIDEDKVIPINRKARKKNVNYES